jgi:hypothetical protein
MTEPFSVTGIDEIYRFGVPHVLIELDATYQQFMAETASTRAADEIGVCISRPDGSIARCFGDLSFVEGKQSKMIIAMGLRRTDVPVGSHIELIVYRGPSP